MIDVDEDVLDLTGLPEPERPLTPPPSQDTYDTLSGRTLRLRLVSKHVLFVRRSSPSPTRAEPCRAIRSIHHRASSRGTSRTTRTWSVVGA